MNALRVSQPRIVPICTVVDLLHARAYGVNAFFGHGLTDRKWNYFLLVVGEASDVHKANVQLSVVPQERCHK